ncbi:ankyrin repeat domain-containing protein [bacterium]|nr:ankyrin repeat domain-containing protein [bacterium]
MVNSRGDSVCHSAFKLNSGEWSRYNAIQYLIDRGAPINSTDKNGLTILDLSYKYNYLKLAKYIKEKGGKESLNSPYTRKGVKGFLNRIKNL